MKVHMSKSNGQYYIEIAEDGDSNVLLVNPTGGIQSLCRTQLESPTEFSRDELLTSKIATHEQLQALKEYMDRIADEPVEGFINHFAKLTPDGQKKMLDEFMKKLEEEGF